MGSQSSKTVQTPRKNHSQPSQQQDTRQRKANQHTSASEPRKMTKPIAPVVAQAKEIFPAEAIEVTHQQAKDPIVEAVLCKNEEKAALSVLAVPVPSKLKRFRVNVPQSMEPGETMTIKLNGVLTRILITTPTTKIQRQDTKKNVKGIVRHKQSSQATASTTTTESTLSSSSTPPSEKPPVEKMLGCATDTVVASTEAKVPDGKKLVRAGAVIAIHAEFQENNKQLKESMVDQVMKEIIQETVNNGCNSILGMTVSIKPLKEKSGYLVKACGTPCSLLPAQVLLERSSSKASSSVGPRKTASSSPSPEKPLVRRQLTIRKD
ncbi:expressed unknown protein [Seminavis robusta]|uniref:Uncharacterized protein n=1 Tax=Seminavis robusta TaxID=568900 RepID=A0A9N8HNB9_9STRA|nr:expressed unknown protein [Seminavis robusta]|eukprot:Sro1196_g251460.1 n/a (321) ;mRNA; f:8543-9505